MYTLDLATESLQFSERYIDAPKEITMHERKLYCTQLAPMCAGCPLPSCQLITTNSSPHDIMAAVCWDVLPQGCLCACVQPMVAHVQRRGGGGGAYRGRGCNALPSPG